MPLNLKKSFVTGLFAIVPLLISLALLVWFFQTVDDFFSPPVDGLLSVFLNYPAHIPGTGFLTGLLIIFVVGSFARNVVGARILAYVEGISQRIPLFNSIYSTVKQLTNSFSPDNKSSFKEVLFVQYPRAGSYAMAFRTGTVELDGRRFAVAYVPTNNLYLGELLFFPEEETVPLELSVESAMKLLLSAGTSSPARLERRAPGGGAAPPAAGGS